MSHLFIETHCSNENEQYHAMEAVHDYLSFFHSVFIQQFFKRFETKSNEGVGSKGVEGGGDGYE